MIVRQDTLSASEREFAKALGARVPAYWDVLTTYALELKQAGTVKSPNFSVTPSMRAEVYRRLQAKGVTLGQSTFDGGTALIDEQLGYTIARYVFGRATEFRRRAADDRQVQTALGLLSKASTPQALLSLAAGQPVSTGR
jgi:hypothetical protein